MRAFEVLFTGHKEKAWYKITIALIACAVIYTALASMITFYNQGIHWLGFKPD
jgi:hypothetical protein